MKQLINWFKRLFKKPQIEPIKPKEDGLTEVWVDKKKTLKKFNEDRYKRDGFAKGIVDAYATEHREVLKERVRKNKPTKKSK